MIPIELTLQGLYSYREKQTIDFEPLIAAGLFGLFGPVGSGKSSILEAMMLALFNKTERLSQAGRNYNIMNLQSNELFIDFTFYAGKSSKEKYRTTYVSKRNSKNFEDVSVKERNYYKWDGNQWIPLDNIDDASSILGMSYDNFMKTIIIPQGKFRDFVDQTTSARTQMLKDLFPLEQFDLFRKTNKLLDQTKAGIQAVEKVLEELGDLGTEDISALENEINSLKDKLALDQKALLKHRKAEENLRALELLYKAFYEKAEILKQLKSDQEFFFSKESQLNIYIKAYTYFREKLDTLADFTRELKTKKIRLEELQSESSAAVISLKSVKERFEKVKMELNQVEETKTKCDDLKLIIEIGKLQTIAQKLNIEALEASQQLQVTQETMRALKNIISTSEEEIIALENSIQGVEDLKELFAWMERERELKKELEENLLAHEGLERDRADFTKKLEDVLGLIKLDDINGQPENQKLTIEIKKKEILQKLDNLHHQLVPLQVKQQLSTYANTLEEGDPCPLCGSVHHPAIAEHETVTSELEALKENIQKVKTEEKQLSRIEKDFLNIQVDLSGNLQLLKQNQSSGSKIEEKIAFHHKHKPQIEEGLNTLEKVKAALEEKLSCRNKLAEKKKLKEKSKHQLFELESAFEEKRNVLQEILKQETTEDARVNQMKGMLKVYEFSKFEKYTLQELSASLQKGKNLIDNLNKNYEESVESVHKSEQKVSRLNGQLSSEEKALEELLNKISSLDQNVQLLLKEKDFVSVMQVQEILKMNLNIDKERSEIDTYKTQVLQLEQEYNSLKKEINNREYTASYHHDVIQEIIDLEEDIKNTQAKVSLKNREIEEIIRKMERKNQLFEELHQLELRKQNLSELCNLFRGNGFMNYVSSIYLNNLCKSANDRFLLLTKNNLSLELNEQNDFIVRDFLNNGKTRLLKTLSGGQTFQASLCLALALAENVKVLNQADQSFFFLDEGFGALDKNALRVVFETLKTLRKENRIVGIISHVEELQQEIDVYIEVENHRDSGSQISFSWK